VEDRLHLTRETGRPARVPGRDLDQDRCGISRVGSGLGPRAPCLALADLTAQPPSARGGKLRPGRRVRRGRRAVRIDISLEPDRDAEAVRLRVLVGARGHCQVLHCVPDALEQRAVVLGVSRRVRLSNLDDVGR
jgi:hypothetical protein